MSVVVKKISIVVIVLGVIIMAVGVAILILYRKRGTVILEFSSVCDNDEDKKCDVKVIQNDVTKQTRSVSFFVWGVEQMGATYKVHNDVNPLCEDSPPAGRARIAQLDPTLNSEGYTCQTIQVQRKNWYPQILSYGQQQLITLAPHDSTSILQQSGLSFSDDNAVTSTPTSKDYKSNSTQALLSTSLAHNKGDNIKFTITGYDAKTKLWSIDESTCTHLGLDKSTGLSIEPVCKDKNPLARISVSGNGKKWYLTAGYFEPLPNLTSSGYSSIVFWCENSCSGSEKSKYCQFWQIVDSASVPDFDLSQETLTTDTGASVGASKWKQWLSNIQGGTGPTSISNVGMIDLTAEYLMPYAVINPN